MNIIPRRTVCFAALSLALHVLACREQPTNDPPPSNIAATLSPPPSVTASSSASPNPPEASPPAPPSAHTAIARFIKDDLEECTEFNITGVTQEDGAEALEKFRSMADKEATKLKKGCAESFNDRKPLATCTVKKTPEDLNKTDAGVAKFKDLTIVAHFYGYESVANSDQYLKECMEMGGTWNAAPHETDTFMDAERRWRRKKLGSVAD